MIRILLLLLFLAVLIGGLFLYFWDIPVEQQAVEFPIDERVLRD